MREQDFSKPLFKIIKETGLIKKFTDYVGSVTSQDIMSVAKKYFVPTNKTVAYVNK